MPRHPNNVQVSPVDRTNITEIVASRLLGLLAGGVLRPGDRVPLESDLAAQLRVSRTTVREALKLLAMNGVLVARRGDGTYVRTDFTDLLLLQIRKPILLCDREVNNIVEVRAGLEVKSARLAAVRATPEDVEKMAVFRLLREIDGRDTELETELDMQFHAAIAAAAHNELLLRLMSSVSGVLRQYIALSNELTDRLEDTINEHQMVFDGISSGDPDVAAAAMVRHLTLSRHWIVEAGSRAACERVVRG